MRFENATTDHTSWDFNNHHVQAELSSGEFISSDSILICAGPPTLESLSHGDQTVDGGVVFPIGVLAQFQVGQNQQLQPVFEIGSSRAYFIPGKNVGSVQMGRTLFSGPSLLKVAYAYYRQTNPALSFQFNHKDKDAIIAGTPGQYVQPDPDRALLELPDIQESLPAIQHRPGYGDFWIDLSSDIFKQPLGLMFYLKNSLDIPYGAAYIENAYIGSHNMSLQPGNQVLVEAISMQFDRLRPVDVGMSTFIPASAN